MPVVKTVRSRGATIVVEAHAEVLFTRNGPVGNFTRVFSGRVRSFTAAAAPGNSRPTWGHEPAAHGRPLKATFMASTRYAPAEMRVYSAVGSTANYSAYVDQGTGVFNGHSPWRAKVLPPRTAGGSDLYEHTWRPGGQPVREMWIQGQRPQFFFARGLDRAFKSMRIATRTVPGTATLDGAVTSFPDDLANFAGGATPSDSAFRASLTQWRAQRDAAWFSESRARSAAHRRSPAQTALRDQRTARRKANAPTTAQRAAANRKRQAKFRADIAKAKGGAGSRPKQAPVKTYRNTGEKNAAAIAAFKKRNPGARVIRQASGGVVFTYNGRQGTASWGQLYGLL